MSSDGPDSDPHPEEHHSPQPPPPPSDPNLSGSDYYLEEARGCIRSIFPGLFLKKQEPPPLQRSRASGPPPREQIAWARVAGLVAVAAVAALVVGWCVVSAGDDNGDKPANSGLPASTASASPGGSPSATATTASPSVRPSASPSASASASATSASPSATTAGATPAQPTATSTRTNTPPPGATSTSTPTATTVPPTSTPTNTPLPPTATRAPITNFSGTRNGPACAATTDNPPYRWGVTLSQDAAGNISGTIFFHNCPGGGQAWYDVTGKATSAPTVQLAGSKTASSRGPLGGSAAQSQTFTLGTTGAPNPNLAP